MKIRKKNSRTIPDRKSESFDFLRDKSDLSSFHDLLAKDFLYSNSSNLVTFIDNHDVGRANVAEIENDRLAHHHNAPGTCIHKKNGQKQKQNGQ